MKQKLSYSDFLWTINANLGYSLSEARQNFYVKVNKGTFNPNQDWVDFVLALLLFQIKNNVSDLFYKACNNINWEIKYIRNGELEPLSFDDIEEDLYWVIDFIYKDQDESFRQNKKNYYKTFFGYLNSMSFNYDQQELKDIVDTESIPENKQQDFEALSERQIKLLIISKINEALGSLYWFTDQVRNMDSNIVIGYGKETDKIIPEYSFRIAAKQQDIEIGGKKFLSITQRFMVTEFFPLQKLGLGDYESFVRTMLLAKKLNIIAWETSSGKTTTILSLLSEIYTSLDGKINLYSFEDPIEKPVPFMIQTQAAKNIQNEEMAYSAEDAERFFLRAAPDGILIGEMRDAITAQIAVKMAMSGHYCYATLHCDNVLSAIPRFAGWGLDVKSNITSLGFVEVTQLLTTFPIEDYKEDNNINEKIESGILKIKDLQDIPYEKLEKFELFKIKKITKEESGLTDKEMLLFDYINGRSFLKNLFQYYKTGDVGTIFSLQGNYTKYLYFLSTYFSNRYVDGVDYIDKKQYLIPFLKCLHIALKDKDFEQTIIQPELKQETIKEIFVKIQQIAKEHLDKADINLLVKGNKIIWQFLTDGYVSSTWTKIPFSFKAFLDIIGEFGYMPFKIKSKGRVPMVEFFDYTEDFRCVLQKNYDHLYYWTQVFTPMFLYAYTYNQQLVHSGKCIDFFKVISMFKTDYEF